MNWNNGYGLETIPGKIYYLHTSAYLSIKTVGLCKVALVETRKLYGGSGGTSPPILNSISWR